MLTRLEYEAAKAGLSKRPCEHFTINGRTAVDVDQLEFIVAIEGLECPDSDEQAANPVGSPETVETAPAIETAPILTPSGVNAMTVGVRDMVKAGLIEVAEALGLGDVSDSKVDSIREAIRVRRESILIEAAK